jgi:hypothetical protein
MDEKNTRVPQVALNIIDNMLIFHAVIFNKDEENSK